MVPINKITDPMEGKAERIEGYAEILLDDYDQKYGIKEGEIILIISNSGRNPLPIEICLESKKRRLKTVAIISLNYSSRVSSRHSSGKNLYEIADHVLDNYVELGDSFMRIPNTKLKIGASSTVIGSLLVNILIISEGMEPPILKSMNLDNADEYNKKLLVKYNRRLNW